jgi:RNA polymerase sigma factor (TIGR02999 family)
MIRQFIRKHMEQLKASINTPASAGFDDSLLVSNDWDTTDEATRAQLVAAVYPQLKQIAEVHMRRERHDHTLQPTALVNEFFLVLARQRRFTVNGRAHFLAIASRAMRRLLIDHARSRNSLRHGGAIMSIQLDPLEIPGTDTSFDMLELDQMLDRLFAEEPRMARVAELKCFGGLTFAEISEVLSIDERTAKRDWQVARAWLFGHLKRGKPDAD